MKLTKKHLTEIPNLPKERVIGIFEKYLGPLVPDIKNTNFNYIDGNTISFDFTLAENTNIPVSMPLSLFVKYL